MIIYSLPTDTPLSTTPMMCNCNSAETGIVLQPVAIFAAAAIAFVLLITANLIVCFVVCLVKRTKRKGQGPTQLESSSNIIAITTSDDAETNMDHDETLTPLGGSVVDTSTSTNEAYYASGITVTDNPAYEPVQGITSMPEESLTSYAYIYAEAI